MGLQSALTTSLTGLQAAETSISVVGNNVANSNTVGFKESNTIFATQFLQTISIGSAPNTNSGGTNPQQVGLGVQVAQIAPNFSQGTIEISANPLDVAIQGDGFLIVQGLQGEELYTRNGQLSLNSLNELTTTNGQRVLGFGVDDDFNLQTANRVPLTIPLGEQQVAQATTTARLAGTLNPAVDRGAVPSESTSAVFTNGNLTRPDANAFTPATDLFVSEAPAAPTTLATGTAGTGPGTAPGTLDVTYRIAFRDTAAAAPDDIGALSPAFTITGHTAGESVEIDGFPANLTNGGFDEYVIYRQEEGGTRFFEVGSLASAATPPFVDATDEATLLAGTELTTAETGNIEEGNFTYFATYFNPTSQTETAPTLLGSQSINVSGGGRVRVDLQDLTGAAAGFTELRIYRNVAGSDSDFRLVADGLSSSAALTPTQAFIDDVPSSDLGASLNFDGDPPTNATRLLDLELRSGSTLSPTFTSVFPGTGTLTFDANIAGIDITQQSFEVTADTTVENLAGFLEDALGLASSSSSPGEPFADPSDPNNPLLVGEGGSVRFDEATGQFIVTSNLGEQNAVEIPLTAFNFTPTGSSAAQPIDIRFSETQSANGPGTTTELTVFDSLGLPISVRVTTVLERQDGNSTTYRWFATSGNNEPNDGSSTVVGDGLLTFDANGDLLPGSIDQIAVQRNDTASVSPLAVTLDFSGVSSLGTTDAQGNLISNLNFTSQDGFPPGVLTDFIITDDGTIQGQFSNGVQRPLGQIQLARFINNQGLQAVGDNLFAQSVNSGEPIFGTAGANGLGTLTAGAVELSNTDIGQNLIELILASTQYRGGSRVITATQELLDELLALQR